MKHSSKAHNGFVDENMGKVQGLVASNRGNRWPPRNPEDYKSPYSISILHLLDSLFRLPNSISALFLSHTTYILPRSYQLKKKKPQQVKQERQVDAAGLLILGTFQGEAQLHRFLPTCIGRAAKELAVFVPCSKVPLRGGKTGQRYHLIWTQ